MTVGVMNVGHASRHAGTEIGADRAENDGDTSRHIFTSVGSAALDDHDCAGVPDTETFPRAAAREHPASRGTIKDRVADNRVSGTDRAGCLLAA